MPSYSDKQLQFWRNATHRWNIKTGATRSGKTYMDYFMIPRRVRACTGAGHVVLLGNTKNTLERNVLEPMRNLYGAALVGNISSDNRVWLFGRRAWALGADKVNQVSKIQGSGMEYCYGDEVTTWHEDVFTMLKSRLDKPNSCFDGTCNPDNPNHWFKQFLDSDADIYHQHYTIDDNPFNDPVFVRELKKEYWGTVYYSRFIEGLWVAAEGIIYRRFADDPDKYIIDTAPPVQHVNIGVDFGGNKSATMFVATGFTKGYKQVIILDEEHRPAATENPETLNRAFVDFCQRIKKQYPMAFYSYCDSAEQILIRGLDVAIKRSNIGIQVKNALKTEITGRIRLVNSLMAQDRFKVMRGCKELITSLQVAVWDEKSETEDLRLDNGTYNVDVLDAAEYSIEPVANFLQVLR